MLYNMCQKSSGKLTWQQMEHAIKRNFGGFTSDDWNLFDEFDKRIVMDREKPNLHHINEEVSSICMYAIYTHTTCIISNHCYYAS